MLGQTVAHYRIDWKLGEGGMGVVYKAWDTHLDRFVAIKVLPPGRRTDTERQRRFVQEAKAASALNHPNIVHIYDINTADGVTFIVMEYVAGRTLDALIRAGRLPMADALGYAVQIADALSAAHAAGIIHRDIKPGNIMVADSGQVKVLDFGLAKLTQPDQDATPTVTGPLTTAEGEVLGTPAYVSPEQAEGRKVDARSDIFSFGAVLYEMTTGERPFAGRSTLDVLHAVTHEQPRLLSDARVGTPPELRMIIEKALEKDPADRYQSTRDLVVDLKRAQRSPAWSPEGRAEGEPRPVRRNARSVLAAALLLLAAAAALLWRVWPVNPDRTNPLTSAQFRRLTDFEGAEFDAALSADGNLLAFLSDRDAPVDLWVTQIGTGQFSNLTKGRWRLLLPTVQTLAFSPEGTHIGLNVGGRTELVPVLGGSPRPLLDPGIEAVWSLDGRKLAFHELTPGDPIFIADADGSNRTPLFKAEPGQHNHYLSWSPDGRYLYFARGLVTSDEMDVWRIPTRGGEPERLTFHNARTSYPVALDDQSLLYISTAPDAARTILYSMDLRQRVPRPINLGVQQYLSLAASHDRRRLVVTESNPSGTLWTMPISEDVMDEGAATRFALPNARAVAPRAAPDYLLYLSSTGGADGLWRFEQGAASELWNGDRGGLVAAPAVSSDGKAVAFSVRQEGHTRLYRAAGGGANPALLTPSLEVRGAPSWSPDGRWVAVSGGGADGPGLFKVPARGGSPARLLKSLCFHPLWSPDGRFIVYAEDDQSGGTLRVRAITPEGSPVPVADLRVSYVSDPYRFVPGSKNLVVLQGGIAGMPQNFWLVDLESGRRRQLTKFGPTTTTIRSFDVTADGKTIVFDRTRENADIVLIERGARSRLAGATSKRQQ